MMFEICHNIIDVDKLYYIFKNTYYIVGPSNEKLNFLVSNDQIIICFNMALRTLERSLTMYFTPIYYVESSTN